MSLNGLDDARVKEAHEVAVAEPGGWFLLKYASRDEVELLGRGNGGIVEIRNNIAQYEDKSPLYGFLRYRRRNVIIKYLPEDCSRLIQARVAVHFNAVCDRFSPHDTTFSIAEPKELKDTKLSAACSLHTASDSTSSSTSSLRRRRLMEITEEEEEEERERKRQSIVKEEDGSKPLAASNEPPVKLDADLANSPEASRFANDIDPPHFMGVPRPSSPAKSFDETSTRLSSQTSRSDLYPTTSYPYLKPRVKLGPRPSADTGGRPRSSAGGVAHRPVSTVPAGLKSFHKGSKKGRSRSEDQDEEGPEFSIKEEAENTFLPVLPLAAADFGAKPSGNELAQPPNSSGDDTVISTALKANMPAIAPPPNKQNTMTPEKARLLKAMKLREKKKMMSLQPTLDIPAADIPSTPSTPGLPDDDRDLDAPENDAQAEETSGEGHEQQDDRLAVSKADSGIEIDVGTDHASVDTHTDSLPTSPVASSDIGDSTQASSLSDSTDETVLAKDQDSRSEDGVDDSKPTTSTIHSQELLAEENVAGEGPEPHDGQSEKAISVAQEAGRDKEEPHAAIEDKIEQNESATLDAPAEGAVTQPLPISLTPSVVPLPPSPPEQAAGNISPAETITQPALDATETVTPDTAEEERAPSPQIRIPVSKFSTQETKSPTDTSSQDTPSTVAQAPDSLPSKEMVPPVPEKDADAEMGEAAQTADMEQNLLRRKLPEPIRTDLGAPENDKRRSILSITENDGFMDELQSATVQQATPISVSKSPISPFFSIDPSSKRAPGGPENSAAASRFSRTVSNPVRNSFLAPGEASTAAPPRSVSSGASYLQRLSQQQAAAEARPKSSKLGSSISQRIKALEQLSGPPGSAGAPTSKVATSKERPSSTFFAVRKASTRETSRPSSVAGGGSSIRGRSPSPPPTRDSSPETTRTVRRDRSGSLVNRLSMFEGGMTPRGRPESVQVTARIVRDPNQPFPKAPESKASSPDYVPMNLKQSPLVVDVQNRVPSQSPGRAPSSLSMRRSEQMPPPPNKQSLLERRLSKEYSSQSQDRDMDAAEGTHQVAEGLRPRRRSSLSVVKDFIKDRTDSLKGAMSPSTDNLGFALSSTPTSFVSPTNPASRSPSRPPSLHQAGSLARRLSISSRRSSIEQNTPVVSANTSAILSAARAADAFTESESDAKSINGSGPASPNQSKASRTSRFMRRLSNTLVAGRTKNGVPSISPTVAEENAADVEAASRGSTATTAAAQSQPTIVAFMGDVNVQFPDNLLWKRRSICLDSQGFLILSAVSGTPMLPTTIPGKDKLGAMVKRYHMSDFKPPYAPDVELQELPNSVVLDLVDGSGLQIACEDRAGQMSILHILEEAHQSHTSFGR